MPVQPIDLQTLFSQMNQVSKDQNAAQGGAAISQAVRNAETQKKDEAKTQVIAKAEDAQADSQGVKNDVERRGSGGAAGSGQGGEREKKDDEAEEGPSVYKDPDLGSRLDVSG
jgi:hypothetical protein